MDPENSCCTRTDPRRSGTAPCMSGTFRFDSFFPAESRTDCYIILSEISYCHSIAPLQKVVLGAAGISESSLCCCIHLIRTKILEQWGLLA